MCRWASCPHGQARCRETGQSSCIADTGSGRLPPLSLLERAGRRDLLNLDGGTDAWQAAGYKMT